MTVRLLRESLIDRRVHPAGSVVELDAARAKLMIRRGHAVVAAIPEQAVRPSLEQAVRPSLEQAVRPSPEKAVRRKRTKR